MSEIYEKKMDWKVRLDVELDKWDDNIKRNRKVWLEKS